MDTIDVIILGILQGISEFLPISSSGHLILAPIVFGFEDQGLALDAVLHLASLLSIIIFFRKELIKLLWGLVYPKKAPEYKTLSWSIIAATFPAGIVGLLFDGWIEENLRSATFVAWNLIVWSIVFFIADQTAKKRREQASDELYKLSFKKVMFVGFAQAIALLPGTSRSGITITAGVFNDLSQPAAARLSFLLGTPIIMAAGLHKFATIIMTADEVTYAFSAAQLGIGFLTSFVVGYISISLLLKILAQVGMIPFIIYRIALALIILYFFGG